MYVYQVMTSPAISVYAEATVAEIVRLMTTYRIRSVPVVDQANRVLGLVRERDVFVQKKGVPFSRERLPALCGAWVDLAHSRRGLRGGAPAHGWRGHDQRGPVRGGLG